MLNQKTKKKSLKKKSVSFKEDEVTLMLYQMTKDISEMFDKFSIQYWADGGTFLGAVRHKGIIPWDDDVDVGTLMSNKKKITSVAFKKFLSQNGYQLLEVDYGFKIFSSNGMKIKMNPWAAHIDEFKEQNPTIKARNEIYTKAAKTYQKPKGPVFYDYKYPFVDIFLYRKVEDKLMTMDLSKWYSNKCYYLYSNLTKLKKQQFGSFKISIMPDANRYFTNCYGTDWNINGYVTWDHKNEKFMKDRRKIKLQAKHRVPAKPFGPLKNNIK